MAPRLRKELSQRKLRRLWSHPIPAARNAQRCATQYLDYHRRPALDHACGDLSDRDEWNSLRRKGGDLGSPERQKRHPGTFYARDDVNSLP